MLPDYFHLYFSTTGGNVSFIKGLFRLITKLLSKGEYEHVVVVIKCPDKFVGIQYKGKKDKIQTFLKDKWYVFETNIKRGMIITELEERLTDPGEGDKRWFGDIDMFSFEGTNMYLNTERCFQHGYILAGTKYSELSAGLSAISLKTALIARRIIKAIPLINKLLKGEFCSMFAMSNGIRYYSNSEVFYKRIDRIVRNYNPEECLNFFIGKKLGTISKFAKYLHGRRII